MKRGLLIVVSGASGTGKGTVVNRLLEMLPAVSYSVSATTRAPRVGEKDGVNYYFLTKEKFEEMIKADGFLEWANVYGNYYGTPLAKIEEKLAAGKDVLLEIDTQGALNVMKKYSEGVFIFLLPPSIEELAKRIRHRGTETEEALKKRLDSAKAEIAIGKSYGYAVVNDEVDRAARRIEAIMAAERCRTERNTELFEVLAK